MRVSRALGTVVISAVACFGAEVIARPVLPGANAAPAPGAEDASRPDTISAGIAARLLKRPVVVSNLTTERSETVANPDGTYTETQALHAVRVRQGDSWVPVDTTLVADATGVHSRATAGSLVLSPGGTTAPLLKGTFASGKTLGVAWPGTLPAPTLAGSTATYADVLPNADLVVTASDDSVEFSIVLRAVPDASTFPISLPLAETGVSLDVTSAGGLRVRDARGTTVGAGPTPVVFDATGDADGRGRHHQLAMSVATTAQGRVLTLAPERAFLTDPASTYPITVDPSVTFAVTSDTYIQSSNPTTNFNGSAFLRTGASTVSPTNDKARSLITLDTVSLNGKHVTAAMLNLYNFQANTCDLTGSGTNNNPAVIHDITSAWSPATVTWNSGSPSFSNTIRAQSSMARTGLTGCGAAYIGFTGTGLTTVVNGWANGSSNYGVLVKASSETDTVGFRNFYSKDHAGGGPSWTVTYNNYPNVVGGRYVTPAQIGVDGSTRYTSSTTPTLAGASCDPDATPTRVDFEVWNATMSTLLQSGSSSSLASCVPATWTVPTALTNGTTYQWRARGFDGTDYSKSWSSWVPLVVDTTAPNTPTVSSLTYPENTWNAGGVSVTMDVTPNGSTDVAGYLSAVDEPEPTTYSDASGVVIASPTDGPHTLYVRSVDAAGNKSSARAYAFAVGHVGIVSPAIGARTQKTLTLSAATEPGWTQLTWQWRRGAGDSPTTLTGLKDVNGNPISNPLSVSSGVVPTVTWDADAAVAADGPFILEATVTGMTGGPVTTQRTVVIDRTDFSAVTAAEAIGPGTVNLLTGNVQLGATDVSIDAYGSDLTVGRTFNSLAPDAQRSGPLGRGWALETPVLAADASYTQLTESGSLATITLAGGDTVRFTRTSPGAATFTPEYGFEDLTLSYASATDTYSLTDLDGTVTGFKKWTTSDLAYTPYSVQQAGDTSTTTYSFQTVTVGADTVTRLTGIMAPQPPGLSGTCSLAAPAAVRGCRSLTLVYAPSTTTAPTGNNVGDYPDRLQKVRVTAWDPSVAAMSTIDVAQYAYDADGRLAQAWDPRLSTLRTTYTYNGAGQVATLTPPGEEPWTLTYDLNDCPPCAPGPLRSVSRSTLLTSPAPSTATTTIVYDVPTSGTGAPYDMSSAELARIGQTVVPVTATAIFPATTTASIVAGTPSSYDRATVHYLDADGREIDVVDPNGGVSSVEYDSRGNVVRTLTPGNRQRALDQGATTAEEAAVAESLASRTVYSPDGLEVRETWGPEHDIALSTSGDVVRARAHTVNTYDEGTPGGTYHLITTTTAGARVTGETSDRASETRTTKYEYGTTAASWALGIPTATILDAVTGGKNLTTRASYTGDGRVLTETLPAGGTATNTAATRVTRYYIAGTDAVDAACGNHPEWVNLVCSVGPGGQPTGTALPTSYTTYDLFNAPVTVTEKAGGTTLRTTTLEYDSAARPQKKTVTATTGTALPAQKTEYDSAGRPNVVKSLDGAGNTLATLTTTFNSLGQATGYTDADGNASSFTYDVLGRVATTTDGKGSQTWTYDGGSERRGLPTSLVDSHAGTWTATYAVDGTPTVDWPNTMRETTQVDETGSAVSRTYGATSGCSGAACTLMFEDVAESVHGQWLSHASTWSSQAYAYDTVGRLTQVDDTLDGSCEVRRYAFDAGGAGNGNRTKLETFAPSSTGGCQTTTVASTVISTYDAADRLTTSGTVYDALGRTTTVPDSDALDSGAVTASYYTNDLVRSIGIAGGVTKTYTLDVDEQRVRSWTDGSTTRTNHYDGASDSPAWTQESASTWTRNIGGIGGDLAAIYDSATSTGTLQLTNLHGDVVASSSMSAATVTLAGEANEFGNPRASTGRRYGWLGGKLRASDTPSGVSVMGVRLYNPVTGRFLQSDPVPGGSANNYDYVRQDPMDALDLDGRCETRHGNSWNPWGAIRSVRCRASNGMGHVRHVGATALHVIGGGLTRLGRRLRAIFHWTAHTARTVARRISKFVKGCVKAQLPGFVGQGSYVLVRNVINGGQVVRWTPGMVTATVIAACLGGGIYEQF